jgi:translation initiation factor IF-1
MVTRNRESRTDPDSQFAGHGSRLVTGTVTRQLPSGLYEVDVEGARITAHIGGGAERNFVRLLVGDHVAIELTPRNLARGRITRKL